MFIEKGIIFIEEKKFNKITLHLHGIGCFIDLYSASLVQVEIRVSEVYCEVAS